MRPRQDPTADTRARLVGAAFDVFSEHGYDAATVEDIAARAGVNRRTFFRHFKTKEDVIFPDHDQLLAKVAEHLATHRTDPPLDALCAAVRIVFADYVSNAQVSVRRYSLTRTVPALRERELSSVHAYQRLFVDYLRRRLPDADPLAVEIVGAAVVTAHNVTLRRWLRSDQRTDPLPEFDAACDTLRRVIVAPPAADDLDKRRVRGETAVAVFTTSTSVAEVMAAIERELHNI